MESKVECREGDYFSDGYFAANPPIDRRKKILEQINLRLESWKKGDYNELVQNSYGSAAAYLGKARWTKNREQGHHTFSNLIMRGKLRKSVNFICDWETGDFFLPGNRVTDKSGIMDKSLQISWRENIRPREKPFFLHWIYTRKRIFLFCWILRRMWFSQLRGKFQGEQGPVTQAQRLYKCGY